MSLDIELPACGAIVQANDPVAFLQKAGYQVGSDKPQATRNQDLHDFP
jgi:hypothetical protein